MPCGLRRGISSCRMPRPEVIHCTSPGPIKPGIAQAVAVIDRAFEHVGHGLNAAVRVHRKTADRAFQRIVEGEMIEKQERVERSSRLGAIERRRRTPAPSMTVVGSMVRSTVLNLFIKYSQNGPIIERPYLG